MAPSAETSDRDLTQRSFVLYFAIEAMFFNDHIKNVSSKTLESRVLEFKL